MLARQNFTENFTDQEKTAYAIQRKIVAYVVTWKRVKLFHNDGLRRGIMTRNEAAVMKI
jgi:hypothetical protein